METNRMSSNLSSNFTVLLDKDAIRNELKINKSYEAHNVNIRLWEGDQESEYYVADIEQGGASFYGILNVRFRRQNFGLNTFENGDIYFGCFENDFKSKQGAYFFSPKKIKDKILNELYFGYWRNNRRDRQGLYMWEYVKPNISNPTFDEVDFDAYVGKFDLDSFLKGVYLIKKEQNFYVYYGKFDMDGRKSDNKCFFYDSVQERVFIGKIHNDKFYSGHVIYFDEEGKLKLIIFVEFDNKDNILRWLKPEEIEENTKNAIVNDASTYRNLLLEEDYFTQIFELKRSTKEFVNNNMSNKTIFDSDEGYPKIMKVGSSYNDIKIFNKLEKSLN